MWISTWKHILFPLIPIVNCGSCCMLEVYRGSVIGLCTSPHLECMNLLVVLFSPIKILFISLSLSLSLWVRLNTAYFCWNWKHCSEIIFKCVNSAVKPIFNEKVVENCNLWDSWTVNGCTIQSWLVNNYGLNKKKKKRKTQNTKRKRQINLNPNEYYIYIYIYLKVET